jgi:hypothetical protein
MVEGTVVLWGGSPCYCPGDSAFHDPRAARYVPATNSWSLLGDVPEPWSGVGEALWVNVHGSSYVFNRRQLGQYDAGTDQWRKRPTPPDIPPPTCQIWGDGEPINVAEAWGSTIFTWSGGCKPEYGFAFDTTSGQWRPTASAPTGGDFTTSSTTGNGAVFLETPPVTGTEGSPAVHAYVVADDHWVDLPAIPEGAFGIGAHLAWTGSELIAWGGLRGSSLVLTGALYRAGS